MHVSEVKRKRLPMEMEFKETACMQADGRRLVSLYALEREQR